MALSKETLDAFKKLDALYKEVACETRKVSELLLKNTEGVISLCEPTGSTILYHEKYRHTVDEAIRALNDIGSDLTKRWEDEDYTGFAITIAGKQRNICLNTNALKEVQTDADNMQGTCTASEE